MGEEEVWNVSPYLPCFVPLSLFLFSRWVAFFPSGAGFLVAALALFSKQRQCHRFDGVGTWWTIVSDHQTSFPIIGNHAFTNAHSSMSVCTNWVWGPRAVSFGGGIFQ